MRFVIRGAAVVDGSASPPRQTDVSIEDDTIVAVGETAGGADHVLEAAGLTVAPGFIDIHSHSDQMLLALPLAESKLLQGVTCELGGNCGASAAPLCAETAAAMTEALAPYGVQADWSGTGEFLARLTNIGLGPNFATLVGHGNLHGLVAGFEERRPTPNEIQQMRARAQEELAQGAFGISAGLIYPPGCYAEPQELAQVCRAAQGRGFFAIHMRNESDRLFEAVTEAIAIARQAGVPLQISHHKAIGKENWGRIRQCIALIEAAREEGLDITADIYPYTATNTGLSAVLPDWMKSGGRARMLWRLRDARARAQLRADWGPRAADRKRWQDYFISRTFHAHNRAFCGRYVSEICDMMEKPPWEAVTLLLERDGGRTEMMRFGINAAEIDELLQHPWVMIGSDAGAKDLSGDWGHPHPRGYGTFPRILARYVRERPVLSLEEAVRRMTSLPAARLGLRDRGRIAPGYKADLVIFDYARVADRATYEAPAQAPAGIEWVIVNGVVAAKAGELTGARAGRALKPTKR